MSNVIRNGYTPLYMVSVLLTFAIMNRRRGITELDNTVQCKQSLIVRKHKFNVELKSSIVTKRLASKAKDCIPVLISVLLWGFSDMDSMFPE